MSQSTPKRVKEAVELDAELGIQIRKRRHDIGVSQERLAELCGVTFQQIQKYEKGRNRVSFSRLRKIATALQCRARDLVDPIDALDDNTSTVAEFAGLNERQDLREFIELTEFLSSEERSSFMTFVCKLSEDYGD